MTTKELADMPLELMAEPESTRENETTTLVIGGVEINGKLHSSSKAAYHVWLGCYNGHLKKARWDKRQLVERASL